MLLRYRQYSVRRMFVAFLQAIICTSKKFVATLQAVLCTSYICCFVTATTQKLTTTTWTNPKTEEPVMHIHFVHGVQLHKPLAVVAVVHDDTPKLYTAVVQCTQLYTAVYTTQLFVFNSCTGHIVIHCGRTLQLLRHTDIYIYVRSHCRCTWHSLYNYTRHIHCGRTLQLPKENSYNNDNVYLERLTRTDPRRLHIP